MTSPPSAGFVGAAFVYGDFIQHVVQANGSFEERPGCSMVALGAQQEVNRVATFINGPVKVIPLTGSLDVRFVHAPTFADWPLASTADRGEYRQHLDGPPVNGRMINRYATLSHHLFQMP